MGLWHQSTAAIKRKEVPIAIAAIYVELSFLLVGAVELTGDVGVESGGKALVVSEGMALVEEGTKVSQ